MSHINQSVVAHDDYGDGILIDWEYEEDGVYLYTLDEDGEVKEYDDPDAAFVGYRIPGKWKYEVLLRTFEEFG